MQAGFVCRIGSGEIGDLIRRNAGDWLGPRRRVFDDVLFQFFKSVSPLGNEVGVVEFFADDDVEHCQCQSGIGSRPYRNPGIGKSYIRLHRGFNGDDLDSAVFCVQDLLQIAPGASGINRLLAPDQKELCIGNIRHRCRAQRVSECKSLLHCADAAVSIVWAAVGDQKPIQVFAVGAARRREDCQRFRPVFLFLFLELGGDQVQRLVPGYALKFPFALFPDSPERIFQALGRINPLRCRVGFGADPAAIQRRFLHPFDSGEPAVLYERVDAASQAGTAHGAKCRNHLLAGRCRLHGSQLIYRIPIQHYSRSHSAGAFEKRSP